MASSRERLAANQRQIERAQQQAAQDAGAVSRAVTEDDSAAELPELIVSGTREKIDPLSGIGEGVATGVVAASILGGPLGLILGGAQTLMKRRADQNILDRELANNEALKAADDEFTIQLSTLEQGATSEQDKAQLSGIAAIYDAGSKLIRSPDPDSQARGAQMVAAAQGEMLQFASRQEEQAIAREATEYQRRKELGDTQYQRFSKNLDDFDMQSQVFEDVMISTENAIGALNGGTPAQQFAAAILIRKALDPTSAVLTEEANAVGQVGGIRERLETYITRFENGEILTPKQREEFGQLVLDLRETATQFQERRQARFLERMIDAGTDENPIPLKIGRASCRERV